MNIKKYINVTLLLLLIGGLIYSCSGDSSIVDTGSEVEKGKIISLSLALNSPQQENIKTSGNPNAEAESKIYSLEVLVFKSVGEYEAGKRDGYKSIPRSIINGNEYKEISEVRAIGITAGKRDVYVIANAPNNFFSSVANYTDFKTKYESLSTQGLFAHPGTVIPDPNDGPPIGGIDPSDLKTNLTMCHYIKNVSFNNLYDHQYLGYTTNNGRPGDVSSTSGWTPFNDDPFEVERLVARVAIQKIDFQLPASLPFEAGFPSSNYTYHIDSVFMMNVKTASRFAAESGNLLTNNFGHGCKTGYAFLNNASRIANLNSESQYTTYLTEPIFTRNYDITSNDTPLWYYTFENEESNTYPTYFVIGVRYNFMSTKDANVLKTVKCYYPVVVNKNGTANGANHNYIKRNYQYGIKAKITGLGTVYGNNPTLLKSMQSANDCIEVEETVGKNLFPWTGNTYK